MLIAMATLALPKTLLTTVGIVEKNPPFEMPLTNTKNIIGPRVVDEGQMTSMLMAVNIKEMNSVFKDPNLSQAKPQPIRPKAEARLNPATRAAPVVDENPSDLVYIGRKNGGTKRGKVPKALARKTRTKVKDLKRRLGKSVLSSEFQSLDHVPLNESWRVRRNSLLDHPGCRQPRGQRKKSEDAVSPCDVKSLNQSIKGKADCRSSEACTGKHEAIGKSTLRAEPLSNNRKDNLW